MLSHFLQPLGPKTEEPSGRKTQGTKGLRRPEKTHPKVSKDGPKVANSLTSKFHPA